MSRLCLDVVSILDLFVQRLDSASCDGDVTPNTSAFLSQPGSSGGNELFRVGPQQNLTLSLWRPNPGRRCLTMGKEPSRTQVPVGSGGPDHDLRCGGKFRSDQGQLARSRPPSSSWARAASGQAGPARSGTRRGSPEVFHSGWREPLLSSESLAPGMWSASGCASHSASGLSLGLASQSPARQRP